MKSNHLSFKEITFLIFATGLGIFLFFQNPYLKNFFTPGSEDWYVNFSVMIFHPNEAYWNESILLPLIGKLTGASRSLAGYKVLCALISMMLLPTLAALCLRHFKRISHSYFFIICFSISFRYLWSYDLGHPDPLTILFLCAIPFLQSIPMIFICAIMATLSHFSMAIIAIAELLLLYWLTSNSKCNVTKRIPFALIAGVISGRFFLGLWYWLFHYTSPLGRIEFILNSGFLFFYDRYQQNPLQFWIMPGVTFITLNTLMFCIFLFQKKWGLCLGLITSIAISYSALFITVDGLRVFSVVSCGAFVFLLIKTIDFLSFFQKSNSLSNNRLAKE